MLRRLDGHTDSIYSLVFSPDGSLLATGDYGSGTPTVRLWDTVTGQTNRIFHHSREMTRCCGGVGSLAFSSDGSLLASGGMDRNPTVRIWNLKTGTEQAVFRETEVSALVFSPDGRYVVLGAFPVRIISSDTGSEVARLKGHTDVATAIAFNPAGTLLASGGYDEDGTIRIWDINRYAEKAVLDNDSPVFFLRFIDNGETLVSQGFTDIRFWDVSTGKELQERRISLPENVRAYRAMAVANDWTQFACVQSELRDTHTVSSVGVFDFPGRRLIHTLRTDDEEDEDNELTSIAFNPSSKQIAAVSLANHVYLWDIGDL